MGVDGNADDIGNEVKVEWCSFCVIVRFRVDKGVSAVEEYGAFFDGREALKICIG